MLLTTHLFLSHLYFAMEHCVSFHAGHKFKPLKQTAKTYELKSHISQTQEQVAISLLHVINQLRS